MTENRVLACRAAFLHDTQTADLCREQALLERARAAIEEGISSANGPGRAEKSPEGRLPLRFGHPFCPVETGQSSFLAPDAAQQVRRLEILAPVARNGWIFRPAGMTNQPESGRSRASPVHCIPGFPPLPDQPAFLYGFWGERAEEILALAAAPGVGTLFSAFSVRVWYLADITIEYAAGSPGFRSLTWQIGKPSWVKAAQ